MADLMTKYLAEKDILKYMTMLHMEMGKGRAKIAADLHHLSGRKCGDSWDGRGEKGGVEEVTPNMETEYVHAYERSPWSSFWRPTSRPTTYGRGKA